MLSGDIDLHPNTIKALSENSKYILLLPVCTGVVFISIFVILRSHKLNLTMADLKEGMKAPDFTGTDQQGNPVALKNLKGKKVILYFYPRDNTPGCTKEACNLRDNYKELTDKGFEVIGVSADSEKSHQNFIAKFDLPFNLISDTEKTVLKAYGAWGLKKNYGKEYEGVIRSTFIISPAGEISSLWHKVKVRVKRKNGEVRHADIVKNKLEELQTI